MEKILMIGNGGHAAVMADSIRRMGEYQIAGYTDLSPGRERGYPYLGTDQELDALYRSGIRYAAVGIGYMGDSDLRNILYKRLKDAGFMMPPIVDPSAALADTAVVGEGAYVGKNAVLNADSVTGEMAIINTGAIVEHESKIGGFSHISIGAVLGGNVRVGERTFLGAGCMVKQGVTIGSRVTAGMGSIILADVDSSTKVIGLWK